MKPPIAQVHPHIHREHGVLREDPYFWLKQRDSAEVLAYVNAENAYTEHRVAGLTGLREQLFTEMRSRVQESDRSAPVQRGDYWYYSRTVAGKDYRVYCRRKGGMDAAEQVLLDGNALAEGSDYFSLGAFEVSPDHRLLAYAEDRSGGEIYDVVIVDLDSGEEVDRLDKLSENHPGSHGDESLAAALLECDALELHQIENHRPVVRDQSHARGFVPAANAGDRRLGRK